MKDVAFLSDKDIGLPDRYTDAKPSFTARAVLFDQKDRVAVLSLEDGLFYMLPGGKIEEGEDPKEAVKRELLEETGCNSKLTYLLGVVRENRFTSGISKISYYYIAKVVGKKGKQQLEKGEAADRLTVHWVPLEKAKKIIADCETDDIARKFTRLRDLSALKEAESIIEKT